MNRELYIELDHVSKFYKDIKAVDDLSIKVYKGDIYGFLGPNGSGKSTSIRMMLSLIRPSSGQIRLFGQDLAVHRYKTLSRIGALIEKPDFYKFLTARENLKILGRISAVNNLEYKIDENLELVGLTGRGNSKVKTFSQGMRQRLGIAQALLHEPNMIFLDEPANGLDPQGQKEMRQLIQSINNDKGITILISSHILSEIEEISNRMVIIDKGKSIIEGNVQELLNKEQLKVSFFVNDPQKAAKTVQESQLDTKLIKVDPSQMQLELSHDQIPEVTKILVDNHHEIFTIKPVRSLEEYFINLTSA